MQPEQEGHTTSTAVPGLPPLMGFVDAGDWQMEVRPADRIVDCRWSVSRLTDAGWTVSYEGSAADGRSLPNSQKPRSDRYE